MERGRRPRCAAGSGHTVRYHLGQRVASRVKKIDILVLVDPPVDPLFDELPLRGRVTDPVGFPPSRARTSWGVKPAKEVDDRAAAAGATPRGSVAASLDERGDSIHWSLTLRYSKRRKASATSRDCGSIRQASWSKRHRGLPVAEQRVILLGQDDAPLGIGRAQPMVALVVEPAMEQLARRLRLVQGVAVHPRELDDVALAQRRQVAGGFLQPLLEQLLCDQGPVPQRGCRRPGQVEGVLGLGNHPPLGETLGRIRPEPVVECRADRLGGDPVRGGRVVGIGCQPGLEIGALPRSVRCSRARIPRSP